MSFAVSPIRLEIYNYIVEFKRAHDGNSPSMREIADEFRLSTSIISAHLDRLTAVGMIRRGEKGQSRMIEVVDGRWTPPGEQKPIVKVKLTNADARKLLAVVTR